MRAIIRQQSSEETLHAENSPTCRAVPNEVAGVSVSAVIRQDIMFNLKDSGKQKKKCSILEPVLLVCEEAHRYVPNSGR